jgi:hypothetical protein
MFSIHCRYVGDQRTSLTLWIFSGAAWVMREIVNVMLDVTRLLQDLRDFEP